MTKTILVCGYGPGISNAVAERFGAEGYAVALVARSADRLAAGVKALGFPTDLSDPASVRTLVSKVRETLGPITVLEWSAYSAGAGDLLTADLAAIRGTLDMAVSNLLMVVQAALPDLKAQKDGAILVINGGLGYFDAKLDAAAVQWNTMGLSVANAAKHKLVGVLAKKLQSDGIYVGEAMVLGAVKAAASDNGAATIAASTVAAKLWDLYRARTNVVVDIS
jgi:NADP-dependent 3-hydroxy acid dehydrogenase YdfG